MRLYELGSIILIIVLVTVAAVTGRLSSKWWGQDNVYEEATESVEASLTGQPIKDYTPESPEVKVDVPKESQ